MVGAVGRHHGRPLGARGGARSHQHRDPSAAAGLHPRDREPGAVPPAADRRPADRRELRRAHGDLGQLPAHRERAGAGVHRRRAPRQPRVLAARVPQAHVPGDHAAGADRPRGLDPVRARRVRHRRRRRDFRCLRRHLLRARARCRTRAAAAARALVEERGSRMSVRAGMAAALRVPSRASSLRFRWFVVEAGWWVLSVGIVIGIWEITAALGLINTIILPPPHKFVAEIRDQSQFLMPQPGVTAIPLHFAVFTAIGASLRRVLIGLLLGSLAAVLTGSLAFYLRLFRNLTFPTITMLAPIAPAAWIPLAILAFGMGDGAAIFVVFVGIYFTLTLATLNSMNNVDQVYVNTARVLGASRRQIMWHVIFPAILPNLFVVLRMNFFAAWMGVLAAEMVGVRTGLGAVVVMGRQMMNMNLTFLGMAIIGLVGYLLDVGLGVLQKRVLWWRSAARV